MLDVDPGDAEAQDHAATRCFSLPPAVAEVMTDVDSVAYLAPLALQIATVARDYELVDTAARTGGGVSWEAHGDAMRESQAEANRVPFLQLMPGWLASMPDVVACLRTPGARWPRARAWRPGPCHPRRRGGAAVGGGGRVHAGDRVRVRARHARPRRCPGGDAADGRRLRRRHGDGRARREEFTAPADPVERFLYAASLAGFSGLEVLDVDHDFWRFYRLHR